MRAFAVGYGVILAALCAWNLYFDIWPTVSSDGPVWNLKESLRLPLVIVAVPTLAALATATFIHRWRPRKIFDPAAKRPIAAFLLGAASAAGALVVLPLAIALGKLDDMLGDALLMALCSAWATLIVLLALTRRRHAGLCIACDYDIRGSLSAGRCPECGTAI